MIKRESSKPLPDSERCSMFRENKEHLQKHLFSTLDELPAGQRQMLEESWAGSFRWEVFARLDEKPFAVLYSAQASRPNVPVNVLVGLEVLKAGFGWTDEELYQKFLFDLQVRYALGYEQLGDGHFAIRTLYGFRRRLSKQMQETGENLLKAAFTQVTDEQVEAVAVRTDKLRMDSTQIASHMRQFSRLHLLVEVLQRVERMLSSQDQQHYTSLLAPYVESKASLYVYRLKNDDYPDHLDAIGAVMAQLVTELAQIYQHEPVYQMLVRVFDEHFVWRDDEQRPKEPTELSARSLQAPDDVEATFRRKQGEEHRGYVTNITETCHPDNDVQLIVDVQTAPNATDDGELLQDAVPELVERTEVDTLYTDGGYNGPATDDVLIEHEITHVQSAIRGGKPNPDTLSLVDFLLETDAAGAPTAATCPQGQRFAIEPGRASERFIGRPDAATCSTCPLLDICPVRPQKETQAPALYLQRRNVQVAQKRQALQHRSAAEGNLRAAVEATVRSVKHPFRHGKLLVRGQFRVACQMIGSAMMVNVRRIHKHITRKAAASAAVALVLDPCRFPLQSVPPLLGLRTTPETVPLPLVFFAAAPGFPSSNQRAVA